MRSSRFGWKAIASPAALLLFSLAASLAAPAQFGAQIGTGRRSKSPSRVRRETNANRRARIAREVAETYSHRYEVSAGGGYLRFNSGQYLQKNNEVTFYGNANYFLNPRLGILADGHGAYGNAKIGNNDFNLGNPLISEYILTGGPSYRFLAQRRFALTVFGTGGVAYGKFGQGTKGFAPERLGIWSTAWRPAFTAGLNLDYNFYPNLAFRVTPTYIGTLFNRQAVGATTDTDYVPPSGSQFQSNLGLNFGLVYRFGHQK